MRRESHGSIEGPGHLSECREHKIAKRVPLQITAIEAMLKHLRQHGLIVGQGDEAVAHVAWRGHAQIATQAP